MNKEIIYKEDALKQLRLNDRDVIYIDKQETAERIRKIPAKQIEIKEGTRYAHRESYQYELGKV